MFSLDRDSSTPLADQIEQRLHALMVSAQLPPGARLTSIRQLAAQLGVSCALTINACRRCSIWSASGVEESRSSENIGPDSTARIGARGAARVQG